MQGHEEAHYSMFIRRKQSSGFNRSLLITLLAEVHGFFCKTVAGVFIKMLSIVYNLNKAARILGLQLNS